MGEDDPKKTIIHSIYLFKGLIFSTSREIVGVCSLYIYLVYDLLLCNTQLSEHFGGSLVVLFSTCRWRLDLFFF